ncbi:sigma-70 family RNA polymerase sigma factor [Leptospira sp. 2 VSF19]|uniref:Sigma-70 family RNA polymerase sigma factor n=1 Tax=Leptospira soteropolitanensis TaxID=2950025 RepID=A0AAW5VPG1_9LEPT|nr:sigma-70 family RNA polymerase sigma factor [Leptospira soteropolitanensis]MCW7493809.1 sigma-70 family RNA polymerase sigma factor [Leptospira soteropolitanensis]MCW7501404.1 sigma-70 family RNA polymerase sigma factor [Leptospira soteropolitanensis]MCW7523833.1 sigma-70 family RNA polymerase sigma factor [Leptospira soteropolitanensis]MCW7527698.1 sigma-70 family RNA polymerase sigma factor [Leptospira soteropolitanensis]MCW7531551.1 sigma-70 family RNA polymerase sigma factor [Leptospira
MSDLTLFLNWKHYIFSIAYRITGSYVDAEDIVQESYLRWLSADKELIQNHKSYLGSIAARLAFDLLKKASRKKETYIGPYLPEPIPEKVETMDDEKINFAFLVILETLSPTERAVFILRELFDFEYESISTIVGKSVDNCRQIFSRARSAIQSRKKKFDPDPKLHSQLLFEFSLACYSKDTKSLTNLLREDVIAFSDGGGKVHAARIPVPGIRRVISLLVKTTQKATKSTEIFFGYANGSQAVIGYSKDGPSVVQIFTFQGKKIDTIYNLVNPDKLKGFRNKENLIKLGYLRKPRLWEWFLYRWNHLISFH